MTMRCYRHRRRCLSLSPSQPSATKRRCSLLLMLRRCWINMYGSQLILCNLGGAHQSCIALRRVSAAAAAAVTAVAAAVAACAPASIALFSIAWTDNPAWFEFFPHLGKIQTKQGENSNHLRGKSNK